jgi:acetyl esterase/lipase
LQADADYQMALWRCATFPCPDVVKFCLTNNEEEGFMIFHNDLIDPQLRALLEATPMGLPLNSDTLPAIRENLANFSLLPPWADSATVSLQERLIDGPEGAPPVRVLIYRPAQARAVMPALLHIHGGGYVVGKPEIIDTTNRKRAAELSCVVVSVDYRLAPETPHPGPVEDCYAALKWLHDHAVQMGIDSKRIAIGGESSGGGLAAALALMARDRGEIPIVLQYLIAPMLDDRTVTRPDPHPYVVHEPWSAEYNAFGWRSLLAVEPGSPGVSPYAAAARAQDLTGLAPAFISVGALDLFLEENMEYARRLSRAGVPVELHVYPRAFHGFGEMTEEARVSIAATADGLRALHKALHG